MEHHVDFNFQARYFKLGKIDSLTTDIWFIFHGYGQLSPYFIKKFEGLDLESQCIIAPEGLSRFYLSGFSGRVGATWMTKEDRLTDIDNYVSYLNTVYQKELAFLDITAIKIHLMGFSQGTATVTRWALQPQIQFNHLILWAGMLPHDLDLHAARSELQGKRLTLVYGDQDEYITRERLEHQRKILESLELDAEQVVFKGGHDIDPTTLLKLNLYD